MRASLLIASTFVLGAFASPRTHFANVLERRQSSSNPYPSQCSSQCSSVESALNSCSDDKCFCTSTNIQNFAQCLQCTVNIVGSVQEFQSTLSEVTQDCNEEGYKVPSETLTGGSGGSVPTGVSSPTDTFFSSPIGGATSDPLGPLPTSNTSAGNGNSNPTVVVTTPSSNPTQPTSGGGNNNSGNNNGGGLPSLGGSGGALGMGVPQTFVGTVFAGVFLAIAAL